MFILEFEIPCAEAKDLPRNMNNTIHEQKYFIWERAKWRRRIKRYIYSTPSEPLSKAKLTLTRYSLRQPDYDGLVGSFKFVIDAIVNHGIIKDDNMQVIGTPNYIWEKTSKGNYKIKVKIEEEVAY